MSTIPALDPAQATGKAKSLLDAVKGKFGSVPNIFRVTAQAPAVLDGYLGLSAALSTGVLTAKTRERIALAVAETNGCGYCLAAHHTIGGMVGLSAAELQAARQGASTDAKEAAILALATALNRTHGRSSEAQVAAARAAGLSDAEILEVIANVVANILTNTINNVAGTVVDFPAVPKAA